MGYAIIGFGPQLLTADRGSTLVFNRTDILITGNIDNITGDINTVIPTDHYVNPFVISGYGDIILITGNYAAGKSRGQSQGGRCIARYSTACSVVAAAGHNHVVIDPLIGCPGFSRIHHRGGGAAGCRLLVVGIAAAVFSNRPQD